MKTNCTGSGDHRTITPAHTRQTAGAVRPNQAVNVACRYCGRVFPTTRISYTDHGIRLSQGLAVIPRHSS